MNAAAVQFSGGIQPHNNMPPFLAVFFNTVHSKPQLAVKALSVWCAGS
jgi:hypothetical protein